MRALALWLLLWVGFLAWSPTRAAEMGVATLVEGSVRLLRGTTWHKLVPGAAVEDGDIVSADTEAHVLVEIDADGAIYLAGPGALYLEPLPAKRPAGPSATVLDVHGWLKVAAAAPGMRVQTALADVDLEEGVVVMRAGDAALELFMESGHGRLTELAGAGAEAAPRELHTGEFWSKLPGATFSGTKRVPKEFVDSMPRAYLDALPRLKDRHKTRPTLVAEGEISYAEAEPWLTGRQRAVFERRFIGRLRDRTFRAAAAPHAARYPSWDRRLNPRKYAPPRTSTSPATR